jgi:Xaa-Pro aminopeptidase
VSVPATPPSEHKLPHVEFKIDALLVSGLPNVRYLTGYTGSNGLVLWTPESMTLFTDPRYTIQAGQESSCAVKIVRGPLHLAVAQSIRRKRLKRIGFEKTRLTYETYQGLKEALPLGSSLKPVGPIVDQFRMIKSEEEIEKIRRSVQTNSEAFENALRNVRVGISELELSAELDYQMRKLGAQRPAFETIVASGPRTALPHAQPTHERLKSNELVLIDVGAHQDGYSSDMTRMIFMGKPERATRAMYNAVLEAQLAAIAVVRPGVTAQRVDRAARQALKPAGLDKAFVHSTGHGLGLEIHEAPRLGKKDKTRLEAGMVITIEPGAYLEGTGGVRIEDTVLVTQSGCEVLTPTSKELRVL